MTPDKVREVMAKYRLAFETAGVPKVKSSHDFSPIGDTSALAHCHDMLDEMEVFIQQGRMDKVFRWLGFIQGVMWRCGFYTIGQMADHNRPK